MGGWGGGFERVGSAVVIKTWFGVFTAWAVFGTYILTGCDLRGSDNGEHEATRKDIRQIAIRSTEYQ